MKRDLLLLSFIGGVLGTLGDMVVHWSSFFFKVAETTTGHYISQLIFPHQMVTLEKLLMGEFTHILAGGTLGVAITIILKISGFNYSVVKGLGFGSLMWIVHVLVIPNLVAPRPYLFRTFNEAVVDLISHIVWGGIAAGYIRYYYKKNSQNN